MLQHTTSHVGLDVSKASISVALLRPDGHLDEESIPNAPEAVRRLVRRDQVKTSKLMPAWESSPSAASASRPRTKIP